MKRIDNTITLFFGPGGSDEPQRPSNDDDPTILFVILSVLIAAIFVRWLNKR